LPISDSILSPGNPGVFFWSNVLGNVAQVAVIPKATTFPVPAPVRIGYPADVDASFSRVGCRQTSRENDAHRQRNDCIDRAEVRGALTAWTIYQHRRANVLTR
jgi:hypothetical protein